MDDWQQVSESLITTALSLGATKADALWLSHVDVQLSSRKGALEGLERSESKGVTLRTFVGDAQATVSSTDISLASLKHIAAAAVSMAKAAPPDPLSQLAAAEHYPQTLPDLELCEANEPEAEWLLEQAHATEDAALSTPGITNSEGADASHSRSHIGLMIAYDGSIRFARDYASSHTSLSVSVLAGTGTDMQRDYDFSSARHSADLKPAATIGKNAAERTLKRLHPRKIPSATMPVIYDRRVSKQLLSAFASAINGNAIVRGSSFLGNDLGKVVFASNICIRDNPLIVRGRASKPFDGEGVATQPLTLVENGVLTSWLLDMRSANALGMTTTGHATRGMGSSPSPSSTNLTMEAGSQSLESLVQGISYGLLITETFGTGINTVTGDYSQGASGFLIEKGLITSPVAEITIAGHLRDMFARAVPANDLMFEYATNAPSLLVDNMTVAGT